MRRQIMMIALVLAYPLAVFAQETGLVNPLKVSSIQELFTAIIDVALTFAMPIIVLMIMWAGFKMVLAQGNEGAIKDARTKLQAAVVGGVVVFGAKLILEIIKSTVESIK